MNMIATTVDEADDERLRLIDLLRLIGERTEFDTRRLADSTVRSMISHVRLLQRNDVNLDRETLVGRLPEVLNELRDRRGEPLTDAYKRQVGMTVKRLFPNDPVSLINYPRPSQHAKARIATYDFVETLNRIVMYAANMIANVDLVRKIDDLALYNACLTVLMTVATSLRVKEVLQLRMAQLDQMEQEKPIAISTKHRGNRLKTITPTTIMTVTVRAIVRQRPYVEEFASDSLLVQHNSTDSQRRRIRQGYVIVSSESFMRKKLHEIGASLQIPKTLVLGFNSFRKYVVTVLTEAGEHKLAQTINNHRDVDTTLTNYNVVSSSAAEKTFDELLGAFGEYPSPPPMRPPRPPPARTGSRSGKTNRSSSRIAPEVSRTTTIPGESVVETRLEKPVGGRSRRREEHPYETPSRQEGDVDL